MEKLEKLWPWWAYALIIVLTAALTMAVGLTISTLRS